MLELILRASQRLLRPLAIRDLSLGLLVEPCIPDCDRCLGGEHLGQFDIRLIEPSPL